jgi:hypothetical protein
MAMFNVLRRPHRILARLGLLVLAAALGAHAGPAAASEAGQYPRHPFAAQAQGAGLTAAQARALQAEVDAIVAARGGTQIAANRVRWAGGGGDTTVPLPGETRARAAGGAFGCDYQYFCVFEQQHYQGQMHSFYHCRDYSVPYNFNSYENNQTGHTKAVFKYHDWSVIHVTPGAWSSHPTFSGLFTYYIKPC